MSIIHYSQPLGSQFDYAFTPGVISGGRGYQRQPLVGDLDPETFVDEDTFVSIVRATQNSAANSCQLSFRDAAFDFVQPGGATVIRATFEGWDPPYDCVWNGSSSYIVSADQAFWQYLDSLVGVTIGLTMEIIS